MLKILPYLGRLPTCQFMSLVAVEGEEVRTVTKFRKGRIYC